LKVIIFHQLLPISRVGYNARNLRGTQCHVLVTANNLLHIPYNTDQNDTHIRSFFPTPQPHSSWLRTPEIWVTRTQFVYTWVAGVECVQTAAVYCARCNVQRSCTAIEELQELIRTTDHLSVLYSHHRL